MTQVLGSGEHGVQREQLLPRGTGSAGSCRGHPGLLQQLLPRWPCLGQGGYCELCQSVMLLRKVMPSCVTSLPW